MSTFKRTKIVRVPTEEKGVVVIRKDKPNVIMQEKNSPWAFYGDPNSKYYSKEHQYYHLYFLSNDEVKEGHWVYDIITKQISKAATYESETTTIIRKQTKKIIATTDKSLMVDATYFDYRTQTVEKCKRTLAEPSQGFIKKYCEKRGIDEVMVEYINYSDSQRFYDNMLKVASDNTITIRSVKDSWSREEVLDEMTRAVRNYMNVSTNFPDGTVNEVHRKSLERLLDDPSITFLFPRW